MTVNGHEQEFRELFAQEAAKRLASLDAHAVALPDADAADAMLRDAHTLKGSAAVVGFEHIALSLQDLERRLLEVTRGERDLDPAEIAAVRAAVGEVRALVSAA